MYIWIYIISNKTKYNQQTLIMHELPLVSVAPKGFTSTSLFLGSSQFVSLSNINFNKLIEFPNISTLSSTLLIIVGFVWLTKVSYKFIILIVLCFCCLQYVCSTIICNRQCRIYEKNDGDMGITLVNAYQCSLNWMEWAVELIIENVYLIDSNCITVSSIISNNIYVYNVENFSLKSDFTTLICSGWFTMSLTIVLSLIHVHFMSSVALFLKQLFSQS